MNKFASNKTRINLFFVQLKIPTYLQPSLWDTDKSLVPNSTYVLYLFHNHKEHNLCPVPTLNELILGLLTKFCRFQEVLGGDKIDLGWSHPRENVFMFSHLLHRHFKRLGLLLFSQFEQLVEVHRWRGRLADLGFLFVWLFIWFRARRRRWVFTWGLFMTFKVVYRDTRINHVQQVPINTYLGHLGSKWTKNNDDSDIITIITTTGSASSLVRHWVVNMKQSLLHSFLGAVQIFLTFGT